MGAEMALHLRVGAADAVADEVEIAEVLEVDSVFRRERVLGVDDEPVGIVEHVHVREQVLADDRLDGERQVQGTAFDAIVDVVVTAGLEEPDVDPWPQRTEPREDDRQQPRGHALVGADAELSDRALDEGGDVGGCGVDPGQYGSGVCEQDPSGLGEAHRPGTASAVEDARPDDLLEPDDLLAHGRLRIAELVGGGVEGAVPRDGVERHQVAELEPESISQH